MRRMIALVVLATVAGELAAAQADIRADKANVVAFPAQDARFVRFVIHASSGEPCVDELEVYGPKDAKNLALAKHGAKASASSCLPGYAIHQIPHLNDGLYGNAQSWIAASGASGEWAQIELAAPAKVDRVVFSRDRLRQYGDRVPVGFEIQLSADGKKWTSVSKVVAKAAPVNIRRRPANIARLIPPPPPLQGAKAPEVSPLQYAFLGEEHAWLKVAGHADLSPRLVPYNGRVKNHPRRAAEDRIPLPTLQGEPTLDAKLDDAFWQKASRGVARVAWPYDWERGPLVEHVLRAAVAGDDLCLAIEATHLLSAHVAVVSSGDMAGVVALAERGLEYRSYAPKAAPVPVTGAVDEARRTFEFRLPLKLFPDGGKEGFRIGLCLGGKHTPRHGRAVHLAGKADEPVVRADFQYSPLEQTLALFAEMINRFEAKGTDVSAERKELAGFRERQKELRVNPKAERQVYFAARLAKRKLFFREPALQPLERILFVKRQAFEPSHNYSVLLDSAWRPGGGIYALTLPRKKDGLDPDKAAVTCLFDAKGGIARTPMASFDGKTVWFAWRRSKEDTYHIYRMNADGSGVKQITDGVWHDYWPCPLPDGGIAMISSRCKARYLCWRPQVSVLFRMNADGGDIRPLSYANLSEWSPSVMSDGRLTWTRSEYIDKGADFSHTLWSTRPDGSQSRLVFGNSIIQPNGYANGREVPGTGEIACTLISHFGDLNGPIALCDTSQGRSNPDAITSLTPEVPWPGMWPREEYFRDPVPISRDHILVSHAPRYQAGIYVIDRFGNREVLYQDRAIGSMCPTPLRAVPAPPTAPPMDEVAEGQKARVVLMDVNEGIGHAVPRGTVKYLRIVEEVRSPLQKLASGKYRRDHPDFTKWYAAPVDRVRGPYGWPSYVAKASLGIVPVEADGSVNFLAPSGKTLYFQALDKDFNEVQRMRSVVQFQPGENRGCIGCHESRGMAPTPRVPMAMGQAPREPKLPSWGGRAFAYEATVQPVLDTHCVRCHDATDKGRIDLTGDLDKERIPASYKTLVGQGWVHVFDMGYNSGGNAKREPLTFGVLKSKLFTHTLAKPHHKVALTPLELRALKCWVDLNCPLWPDYQYRYDRPAKRVKVTRLR